MHLKQLPAKTSVRFRNARIITYIYLSQIYIIEFDPPIVISFSSPQKLLPQYSKITRKIINGISYFKFSHDQITHENLNFLRSRWNSSAPTNLYLFQPFIEQYFSFIVINIYRSDTFTRCHQAPLLSSLKSFPRPRSTNPLCCRS